MLAAMGVENGKRVRPTNQLDATGLHVPGGEKYQEVGVVLPDRKEAIPALPNLDFCPLQAVPMHVLEAGPA